MADTALSIEEAIDALVDAKEHRDCCAVLVNVVSQCSLGGPTLAECTACIDDCVRRREQMLVAGDVEAITAIDKALARARIDAEIAAAQEADDATDHAKNVKDLQHAEDAVKDAALAVCCAERAAKARAFMEAMDKAEQLGRALEFFTGPHTNLPADIRAALARLPKPDPLHTPVNQLRGGWASQRAWDERLRELMLDVPGELQPESVST